MSEEKEDSQLDGEIQNGDKRLWVIDNQSDLLLTLIEIDTSQHPDLKAEVITVFIKTLKVIHRMQCSILEDYPIKKEKGK
jgi:hypothetical protein